MNLNKKKFLFFYNLFVSTIIVSSIFYYLFNENGLKKKQKLEERLIGINEKINLIEKRNLKLKKEIELLEKFDKKKEIIAKDLLDLLKKEETLFIVDKI
jgi:hypothetical protein